MTTASLTTKVQLTSAIAAAAVSAAQAEASAMGIAAAVVVLDDAGEVKSLVRMDGAHLISAQIATAKAYTAVAIGAPGDDFYQMIKDDPAAVATFTARPELALLPGGIPIVVDGTLIAGVGVAGARTGIEDKQIAEAAVAAALAA